MSLQEIIDTAEKEIKLNIDDYPYWKAERVVNVLKEAAKLAYEQGRKDENYRLMGPRTINIYE